MRACGRVCGEGGRRMPGMHARAQIGKSRAQLVGVSSLLLCEFQALNQGH